MRNLPALYKGLKTPKFTFWRKRGLNVRYFFSKKQNERGREKVLITLPGSEEAVFVEVQDTDRVTGIELHIPNKLF